MKKKSIGVSIFLFGLFAILTILMLFGMTTSFDNAVYELVRSLECSFFDIYFVWITKLGNETTVVILVIILLLLLKNKYRMLMVGSTFTSVVSNQAIKHIIRRPRPEVLKLIKQRGYSFPSGHSMISVAVYGFLIYWVAKNIRNKYLKYGLCTLLVMVIISVGISRIYVGVHYASDVLGGFLLATAELILLINLNHRGN